MLKNRRKGQGYVEIVVIIAALLIITLLAIPRYQNLRRDAYRAQIANDSSLVEAYIVEHYFNEMSMPKGSKPVSDIDIQELIDSEKSYLKGELISSKDIDNIGGEKYILNKANIVRSVNTKLKGDFIYTDKGVIYVESKVNISTESPSDQSDLINKIIEDIIKIPTLDDVDAGLNLGNTIRKEIDKVLDITQKEELNNKLEEALEELLNKFKYVVDTVAVNFYNSALVTKNGDLYTWGHGLLGQLGHGDNNSLTSPKKVKGLSNVKKATVGRNTTAVLTKDGKVYSWGYGGYGVLGHGNTESYSEPKLVESISDIRDIVLGSTHSAAIAMDGTLYMWGRGQDGKTGLGDTENRNTPTVNPYLKNVKKVALGLQHSAAITENGDLYTWGQGRYGQLGHGDKKNQLIPKKVEGISNVKDISLSAEYTVALTEDGTMYTWGEGTAGQIGQGKDITSQLTPKKIEGLSNFKQVASGYHQSYAITKDGHVYSWGYGPSNLLGSGDTETRYKPTQVPNLTNIDSIVAGENIVVIINDKGEAFSWGNNRHGNLGLGHEEEQAIPHKVNLN